MVVTFLATGVSVLTMFLSIYLFRSSSRSPQEGDLASSDQLPVPHDGIHKQDETELSLTPLGHNQSTPPPSNILSNQGPEEQTPVSAITDPGRAKHGRPQESDQASIGEYGFFSNANNVVLYHPVMNNINDAKEKVLKWLAKYTMSGVEFDASDHVPGCHPGTRITILEKLHHWVDDAQCAHQMLWLRGAAGVGKSAILQSLAERLSEELKLGATFFFSRPNKRNNPVLVIPTIAYQLAVRIPPYKEYLKQIMLSDPKLLEKDMERQFNALIAEPFSKLGLMGVGSKWAVLLDGLDECDGEGAQILIIRLISRFTRQHPINPLVWVIASRPEAHLQLIFSSGEVKGSFEEFVVSVDSDDACRDVEKFLRAKFKEIHQNYRDLVPAGSPWPAERDITRISRTSSGLFALATTVVRYIEDPHVCNPISQLATVLSVTEGLEPGSLSALYAFYSVILAGVPQAMLPILKLLLPFYAALLRELSALTGNNDTPDYFPLVVVATIFGLQQHAVYGALRKLHSVIKVPPLDESGRQGIEFYHASFSDYLKTQGGYGMDIDMMTKMWWGYFSLLHGIDSASYCSAISGGRPSVPLCWDVQIADITMERLWEVGLGWFTHALVPECRARNSNYTHPHIPLTRLELRNVFEKIDFSRLFFTLVQRHIFSNILGLFNWLVSDAPPELMELDLVRTTSLRDLDFSCIPETKVALEFNWGIGSSMTATRYADQMSTHPQWLSKAHPIKKLVSKLDDLGNHNTAMCTLLVGKAPSRRCAFIYVAPNGKRQSSFYYVPYRR